MTGVVEGSAKQRYAAGDADRDIVERQQREIEFLKEQVNLLTNVVMHAECDGSDMDDAGCSPIDHDNELGSGIGQEHRVGIDASAGNRDECLEPVRPPQRAVDAADGADGCRASIAPDTASLPALVNCEDDVQQQYDDHDEKAEKKDASTEDDHDGDDASFDEYIGDVIRLSMPGGTTTSMKSTSATEGAGLSSGSSIATIPYADFSEAIDDDCVVVEDESSHLSRSIDNYVLRSSSVVVCEFDDEANGELDEVLGTEHVPMAVGETDMPDENSLVCTRRLSSPCLHVPPNASTRLLVRGPPVHITHTRTVSAVSSAHTLTGGRPAQPITRVPRINYATKESLCDKSVRMRKTNAVLHGASIDAHVGGEDADSGSDEDEEEEEEEELRMLYAKYMDQEA